MKEVWKNMERFTIQAGVLYLTRRRQSLRQDHLGNNRVVMDKNGTVAQATNYYPFGLSHAEYPAKNDQHVQPYKFNGKELDRMFGLDTYDYSARMYSPAIGRFMTMDPAAEKYYSISPYAYCANNPVNAVDLRGDSITFIQGNYRYEYNNGAFWSASGMKYTPEKGSTMENVLNAYNGILNSGDKELINQLSTLEKSEGFVNDELI